MAGLATYRTKRNFEVTPEPKGRKAQATGNAYVIQKHAARRLHYDLRLELDGVLKSWAVTKGPSLVPGEKRLAVEVEDHPLEYGGFEGTIPKGEYGGGAVIVWDRGTWTPIGDPEKALAKGHLEFELHGEKLAGRWHLIRMAHKRGEKRNNWLLIKGEDEAARPEDAPDILEERPESVKTGRVVEDVAGEKPGWSGKKKIEREAPEPADLTKMKGAKKAPLPKFIEPELATLGSKPPAGAQWIHEVKFDGYRLQARIEAGRVKLLTRSGLDWTKKFGGEIIEALGDLPLGTALLDGELVVETDAGAPDFSALQADLSEGRTGRFVFYAFDLLYLDGYDLRALPLGERRKLLEQIVGTGATKVRYSSHFDADGAVVLKSACRLGLEGIVSKRLDAPYRSGRSRDWIKAKCVLGQEFVIGGYVPSTTSRKAIGSLVMGYYEDGKLIHVGRVGTGFMATLAEDLYRRMERIRVPASPFAERLTAVEASKVRYVRPVDVAEVEFRGWTAAGHIRQASFRGLREDKPAESIVRETSGTNEPDQAGTEPRKVRLTHPDRVYWPDVGVTKQGLADYYTVVWRHIEPFIVHRPLALVRCPEGIDGASFFQKHAWKGLDPNIGQVKDPKDKSGDALIAIDDLDGLIGLVQGSALEIHPWGSSVANWERPDMIVMDLDPGEGVPWQAVIDAASEVRERLVQAGLHPFLKTSGGKGLHVVAPLAPKANWVAVKAFTKSLAEAMAADSPERYVATITKSKRRGKILIDYWRNQRGATAIAPYSTRARPGAPVSAPMGWDELSPDIGPAYFTVLNMPARLAGLSDDPWGGFWDGAVPLEKKK